MWWRKHLCSEAALSKLVVGESVGTAVPAHQAGVCSTVSSMRDQIDLLATVTVLGVLEQGKCHLYNACIKLMMLSIVGCGSCSFLSVE